MPSSTKSCNTTLSTIAAEEQYLITGATGFVGQAILLELLNVMPDISITLLIREKFGLSNHQRLDRIKKQFPAYSFANVQVIAGDIDGVAECDLQQFSHIIHCASSVNFTKASIQTNIHSFYKFLNACNHPALKRFIYISTAYVCFPDNSKADLMDWSLCGLSDEKMKDYSNFCKDPVKHAHVEFNEKGRYDNFYLLSKFIAENMIAKFSFQSDAQKMILRPSVVTPAIEHPYPMWCKGSAAIIGILKGFAFGLYRTPPHIYGIGGVVNFIPVDIMAKMIVVESTSTCSNDSIVVRNICVPLESCLNTRFIALGAKEVSPNRVIITDEMGWFSKLMVQKYDYYRVELIAKLMGLKEPFHQRIHSEFLVNNTWDFEITEEMKKVGTFHPELYYKQFLTMINQKYRKNWKKY